MPSSNRILIQDDLIEIWVLKVLLNAAVVLNVEVLRIRSQFREIKVSQHTRLIQKGRKKIGHSLPENHLILVSSLKVMIITIVELLVINKKIKVTTALKVKKFITG